MSASHCGSAGSLTKLLKGQLAVHHVADPNMLAFPLGRVNILLAASLAAAILLVCLGTDTCGDNVPAVGEPEQDLPDTLLRQLVQAAGPCLRYSQPSFLRILPLLHGGYASNPPPVNTRSVYVSAEKKTNGSFR